MSALGSRARDALEKAFDEQIGDHFNATIFRLSGDKFDLSNINQYGDQFESGLIAIKAARVMALARANKVFGNDAPH